MNLYHGTNKGQFKNLELKNERAYLAEGGGIYMTDTLSVAKDYGRYIHHITVDDKHITDFSNKQTVIEVIKNTLNSLSLGDIYYDIDMEDFIEDILLGTGSILTMGREIGLQIDSYDHLHRKYESVVYDMEEMINNELRNHIGDVIKYKSKDIPGLVYLCFRNPEVVEVNKIEEIC